jgi:uncharacterized protein (TIGR03086 family)
VTRRDIDLLESVVRTTQGLVDQLEPADLDRPTPCEELDVRRLVEHLIGWEQVMAACAADLEPALLDGSPTYRAGADISDDLRAASTDLVDQLRRRTDHVIVLPYRGLTSVDVMHAEQLAEHVIHTWDLGAALGVRVSFEPEVVNAAHDGLTLMLGEVFAETGFRSPPVAEPGPTELDRLLVRSGRSPATWPMS